MDTRLLEPQQRESLAILPDVRAHAPATPSAWYCAGVALLSLGLSYSALAFAKVKLPYDEHYGGVIYLMWSGNVAHHGLVAPIVFLLLIGCLVIPMVLVCRAVLPGSVSPPNWQRGVNLCFRYALLLPLVFLLGTNLSRYVSNLVYLTASSLTWDVTPYLVGIEAPILESLQRSLDAPGLRGFFSWLYSVAWYIPVVAIVPLLILRDQPVAANRVLSAKLLAVVLAVPFFVLAPIFEPWTLNPLYGYDGPAVTHVRYLHQHADVPTLTRIARDLHWATGSCLPSLHFAIPCASGLVLWRCQLRILGAAFLLLAALTAFGIVYLGRHWIIDVLAAVPYSMGIAWASERLRWRFTLPLPSAPR
jgi:membrane-associated phospholipid phosphatase